MGGWEGKCKNGELRDDSLVAVAANMKVEQLRGGPRPGGTG